MHGNDADEARQDLEGMQIMRNLGHTMAWMLTCFAVGSKAGVTLPEAEERVWTNFIRGEE